MPWSAVHDSPGAYVKELGAFTERNIRIGALKLDAGAAFTLPALGQERILFVTRGRGELAAGQPWSLHTAVHLAADEAPTLRAAEESEALVLALPRF